jgi:pimeloyl-ACP methyl ester carboxylesterase
MSSTARRRKRFIPSRARPASLRAGRRAGADYGAGAQPDWRAQTFVTRRLEVEGRQLNVVSLGDEREGPPVLFIHGLGGTWKNWLENMPQLAQRRRAVAVDLPGFGDSEMPADGEITIAHYGEIVERACELLSLGEVDVVGNSMGGFVAAELALVHPERVRRLVLVDAAGISINDLHRWPTRLLMRAVVWQGRWAAGQKMMLLRPRLRHVGFRSIVRHPTRLALDLIAEQAGGPGMPGFVLASDALLDYDFRDRLSDISCPTLVIHGEEDMLVPMADAWEFQRFIRGARVRILPDTGHVPMLERPQTFNALVEDFLD